jgi:hypothetical protein
VLFVREICFSTSAMVSPPLICTIGHTETAIELQGPALNRSSAWPQKDPTEAADDVPKS